jgi:hypothetical protein
MTTRFIPALGFSSTPFDPGSPGRLCRGRERWIEPWELDEAVQIHRLVVSGATFQDDSATDARRGLERSGVEMASAVASLFPRKKLLAFMEDGHPADIPEGAEGIEAYDGYRSGGLVSLGLVRWTCVVSGVREIRSVFGPSVDDERVRGFVVIDNDEQLEPVLEHLFQLVGMSTLDSPPARYQPAALPALLKIVRAVVLMHRDKHGLALGVYSAEPMQVSGKLEGLCEKAGALCVPFAIPPMLARWDRALSELRETWMATNEAEFPVPPAPEHLQWGNRRRRGRRGDKPQEVQPAQEAPALDDLESANLVEEEE